MIDAVIRTGGKQYRVHEGSVLNVATMDAEPGSRIELTDILLVSHDGDITVGSPTVDGAVVVAEVVDHGKGPKVINFKYKAKTRYRRKRGHRQGFTTLSIREITAGGVTATAPNPVRRRTDTPPALDPADRPAGFAGRVETEEAPVPQEPVAEKTTETPAAEAPATPRRRTRAAAAEGGTTPRTTRRRSAASSESTETDSSDSDEEAPEPKAQE